MPFARPTAHASRIAASIIARRSGSARSTPTGWRDTDVHPASEARNTNFIPQRPPDVGHALGVDARGAAGREKRPRRGLLRRQHGAEAQPRHRPGVRDHSRLGDGRRDVGDAARSRAPARAPRRRDRCCRHRSGTGSPRRRRRRAGATASAAASVSQSLTANSTTSAGASVAGSSVTAGLRQVHVAERALHRKARARGSRRGGARARRRRRRCPPRASRAPK